MRPATEVAFTPLGRQPALDGFRGLAILVVVLAHGYLPWFQGGGMVGVHMFFVLSGFLITSLLLDEWTRTRTIALRDFYARRALRLLPALAVYVAVFSLYAVVRFDGAEQSGRLLAGALSIFYGINWAEITGFAEVYELSHTWSLAVEEQFYLVAPLLMLAALRASIPPKRLFTLLIGLAAASAVWRSLVFHIQWDWTHVYRGTDTVAVSLLLGGAFAVARAYGWVGRWNLRKAEKPALLALLVGVMLLTQHRGEFQRMILADVGWTGAAIAAAVVVTSVTQPRSIVAGWLQQPWLEWLGRVSYGLYLWHLLALKIARDFYPTVPKPLLSTLTIAVSLIVTAASFALVERPFLRLKGRFTHADPSEEVAVVADEQSRQEVTAKPAAT